MRKTKPNIVLAWKIGRLLPRRLYTALFAVLPMLFWPGCAVIRPGGKPAADYYYVNPVRDLSSVGTAVVVELRNESPYPQISADVTQTLFEAIQKKHLFGLSLIRKSDPRWRNLQIRPDSAYNLDQLLATRKALGCDAILIGTLTTYQPYPHMTIGLRLKLIDLNDGQLLWGLEQVWDTADKSTERRIKNYFERQMRSGFAPLSEQITLLSTINFVKFVAYETAETLESGKH